VLQEIGPKVQEGKKTLPQTRASGVKHEEGMNSERKKNTSRGVQDGYLLLRGVEDFAGSREKT